MGRYGDLDYSYLTRTGLLVAAGLVVLGGGGEFLGHVLMRSLPAWVNTVFTYSLGIGILLGFVSIFIFGIALPLTE